MSDWKIGDIVTNERQGFKPRQFRVTDVDDSQLGRVSYIVQDADGSVYWERDDGPQPTPRVQRE